MNFHDLDTFTTAYIECALWSSTDDQDNPLEDNYGFGDLAPDTLAQMVSDCATFQETHANRISTNLERAGHDFWLTRNRHGAGFWDGDWPELDAEEMTLDSHACGEVDLYVGDDGFIYC